MKQKTAITELFNEIKLLKQDNRLDEQTLNVVLWLIQDYLICEEAYNAAISIRNRPKLIK